MKKLLVFCVLLFVSCNSDTNGIACTEEARAGLNVTVRDAQATNYLGIGTSIVATENHYNL